MKRSPVIDIRMYPRSGFRSGGTSAKTQAKMVCPWDKPSEHLGQSQVFFLFCTVEARQTRVCPWDKPGFVPGTNPGPKGVTASQKVYVKKKLCLFRSLKITLLETSLLSTPEIQFFSKPCRTPTQRVRKTPNQTDTKCQIFKIFQGSSKVNAISPK